MGDKEFEKFCKRITIMYLSMGNSIKKAQPLLTKEQKERFFKLIDEIELDLSLP